MQGSSGHLKNSLAVPQCQKCQTGCGKMQPHPVWLECGKQFSNLKMNNRLSHITICKFKLLYNLCLHISSQPKNHNTYI